jgi:hypothetical protein
MHPQTAGIDWTLDQLIFEAHPSGIALAMFERNSGTEHSLGFRWIQHGSATTYFGKNSEWVLLPHDFAVCAARKIIEKKAAGMQGIHEKGFQVMLKYLLDQEEIIPFMGY